MGLLGLGTFGGHNGERVRKGRVRVKSNGDCRTSSRASSCLTFVTSNPMVPEIKPTLAYK